MSSSLVIAAYIRNTPHSSLLDASHLELLQQFQEMRGFFRGLKSKGVFLRDNSIFHLADRCVEGGLVFLVFFTPLAMGSADAWAFSIMEMAVFIIFAVHIAKLSAGKKIELTITAEFALLLLFLGFTVLQLLPLPERLISFLSPEADKLYSALADNPAGRWRTITLNPHATGQEIFKLISYILLFFVVINHYRTFEQIKRVVHTVMLMGAGLAVFAVIQKLAWNGKFFWVFPAGEGVASNTFRVWGPYINHNHFAGYMEMAIPLGMGLVLYNISKAGPFTGLPLRKKLAVFAGTKEFTAVIFSSLCVFVSTGVLFMSLSRGGIIGFLASILFFVAMAYTRKSLKKKAALIAGVGLILGLLLVISAWGRIESRFEEIGEEERIARFDIWRDASGIVRDFPLAGTGLGTFKNIYTRYQSEHPTLFFAHAENDYIEILTDTGIPGFIIAISAVCVFFASLMKRWRERRDAFVVSMALGGMSSCVALSVHSLSDFNLRIPANAMLITIISALTWACVHNIARRSA
ncbi:MAG: O-antigen ligase family protein [Deltaproteobacteria bacterium]|nr:O-antigen ligase family protein [Deltaproteobacteria bacterium]